VIWHDDSQVVIHDLRKKYGSAFEVKIEIQEL